MSSTRNNGTPQGRLTRTTATAQTSRTASPLTPRLAPASSTAKRDPSPPKRPFVKSTSITRSISPEKQFVTPVRAFVNSNVTPQSSGRANGRPGSATSTPGTNTPSSVRSGAAYVSPKVAGYHTPTERDGLRNAARPAPSALGIQSREASVLSPLAQDPIVAAGYFGAESEAERAASPMFFHADEAPGRDKPTAAAPVLKRGNTAFFHANGAREQTPPSRTARPVSPGVSVFADRIGAATRPVPSRAGISEPVLPVRMTGTPSTISTAMPIRSPFSTSPHGYSPPILSPPVRTDHLSTPTITNPKLRNDRSYQTPTPYSPATPSGGLESPNRHMKSSSISALPVESPSSTRKRSATWAEAASPSRHAGGLPRSSPPASPVRSPRPDASPPKDDSAIDARRERKVLDLEISNSSLLAYNRSLEREIKRQKAELKRYRRLSRAGRLSQIPDEDTDLPRLDGSLVGRPSSPFEEDVSDLDDEVESEVEGEGREEKEARQRQRDDALLKADLKRHRELLLDTARVNRSLQRCLTWSETLIRDGRRALEKHEDLVSARLGDDDEVDEVDEYINGLIETGYADHDEDGELDEGTDPAEDVRDIEAFLGIGRPESAGTNRDSGVEVQKLL